MCIRDRPIYWGAPDVKQEFNPAAFLCADDYPDTAALIAAIDEIDRDDEKFLSLIHISCQPWR